MQKCSAEQSPDVEVWGGSSLLGFMLKRTQANKIIFVCTLNCNFKYCCQLTTASMVLEGSNFFVVLLVSSDLSCAVGLRTVIFKQQNEKAQYFNLIWDIITRVELITWWLFIYCFIFLSTLQLYLTCRASTGPQRAISQKEIVSIYTTNQTFWCAKKVGSVRFSAAKLVFFSSII